MDFQKIVCAMLCLLFSIMGLHAQKPDFDVQGHRGCRGLMPENSIPAFLHAMDFRVNTLELDVVITKDKKVIVSHEPWINPAICKDENDKKLSLSNEDELNIYKMNYAEIKKYDCGSLYYSRFPDQRKVKTYKPLLSEVFDSIKVYCTENNSKLPYFNIEIKSDIRYDNIFTPGVEEYCELVLAEIADSSINELCIVQSFDPRVLKYLHKTHPKIKLAFLAEEQMDSDKIVKEIGFFPDIFSPDNEYVTKELIEKFHALHMKVIPWTVNDDDQIKKFIGLAI